MSFSDCYYIKAEEFCVKVTDGTHDSPKRKTEGKFLITSKHIKSREIDFESAYLIDGIDFDKINQRSQVNQWDVLISMIGEYCGFVYVERNFKIDYAVKNVGIFKTGEKEKAEWIYYYLSSPEGKNKLNTLRSGTSQPYISLGALRKLPILQFKNKNIMTGIIKILTKIDEKIHVNYQINKTLENMAQAIFKQWFVAFEFPNEDGEPYKSSGGEMVESELGMIPKGWEVSKFIDLIEITSGKRPGKRSDMAMEDCKYSLVGASSIMGYTDDFNFEEKILVIGRVGTHGVVQRFNNKVWASDNTLVIKSDKYEFAYQILNLIDYKAINRGSTQPLITQTDIKNHTLIIPTESHLNKFELLVGSLFEIHSNHCLENSKLTELRDTLLPKLMSGEIRVPLDSENLA